MFNKKKIALGRVHIYDQNNFNYLKEFNVVYVTPYLYLGKGMYKCVINDNGDTACIHKMFLFPIKPLYDNNGEPTAPNIVIRYPDDMPEFNDIDRTFLHNAIVASKDGLTLNDATIKGLSKILVKMDFYGKMRDL